MGTNNDVTSSVVTVNMWNKYDKNIPLPSLSLKIKGPDVQIPALVHPQVSKQDTSGLSYQK